MAGVSPVLGEDTSSNLVGRIFLENIFTVRRAATTWQECQLPSVVVLPDRYPLRPRVRLGAQAKPNFRVYYTWIMAKRIRPAVERERYGSGPTLAESTYMVHSLGIFLIGSDL